MTPSPVTWTGHGMAKHWKAEMECTTTLWSFGRQNDSNSPFFIGIQWKLKKLKIESFRFALSGLSLPFESFLNHVYEQRASCWRETLFHINYRTDYTASMKTLNYSAMQHCRTGVTQQSLRNTWVYFHSGNNKKQFSLVFSRYITHLISASFATQSNPPWLSWVIPVSVCLDNFVSVRKSEW